MAQRTVSARKDLSPLGHNKAAQLRIKSIFDSVCLLIPLTIADGSTVVAAKTLDAKNGAFTVTDVHVIKTGSTGGSTDAVQLCTDSGGSTAVSSSLALNGVAAGGLVRTTSITNAAFAAGAKLYVARTHTTDCSCTMVIRGYFS